MRRARWKAILLAVCIAAMARSALAQRVTSDILGTVEDPSGSVIVGAQVSVTRVETGSVRGVTTDELGNFHVAGLDPGAYEVRVAHPGFKTTVRRGIILLVNQEAVVDVKLELGDIQQRVVVVGQPPMLETTTAQMSNVVTESTLQELPLNGRDLFQLAELQTGVLPVTNAGASFWSEGGVTKAAVQGTRPTMNNFNLDGGDINDPGFNIYPGGPGGVELGVEAVEEFRVLLNTYSAEYGRNAGANVQFVTRGGTNDFHGSLYEFLRNSALDARNFFDIGAIPPFIRHQFGASLGGPIRRDHTFFFVNYEGLRERKGITASTTVPDANAHMGLLPSAADPSMLVNVGVDPRIAPFLALYPAANGPSLGRGLAVLETSRRQPTREDYGVVRVDHKFSDRDHVFARWVVDDGEATVPFQSTFVPGFPGERSTRDQYGMVSWQRQLGAAAINEAKFSFNRTSYLATVPNQSPLSISLEPGRGLGAIAIAGLPQVGNSFFFPIGSTSNTFEVIDNFSYQRGRHALKVGADLKRLQINGPFDLFVNGGYVFSDLTAFGLPAQSDNPALEFFLRATPFLYFGVDPTSADSTRGFRENYFGFYAQHDWQIHSRLTLNMGLRWEYWSNPSEAHGRLANIRNLATDAAPSVGKIWDSVPLDLWSPRVGFAWTPFSAGKTVVRGGFGLMRDQIYSNLYADTRFYQPFYRPLLFVLPQFVSPPTSIASVQGPVPPQVIGSFGVTFRPDFPYYLQYSLNVERELGANVLLEAAYVGSHGVHLPRTGEANLLPGRRVINPNFGSIPLVVTDATSSYNSLQVSLRKRFAAGLSFQGSYTFSKVIDDQSGAFPSDWDSESGISQNFFNRNGDRARSSFDRRHVFVFNSLYDLPVGPGRRWGGDWKGFGGKIAEGWRIGGILSAMSGLPFTVTLDAFNNSGTLASVPADRPDLKPNVQPCSSAVTFAHPDNWFDPTIFTLPPAGQFGNAGRNIMCGPSLVDLDFALLKQTRLSERLNMEFRAEFFNLFNHSNFDVPVNTQAANGSGGNGDAVFIGRRATLPDGVTACTASNDPLGLGCGILAPNVGRIFRTVTSSRQIQFALKLRF